MGAHLTPVNNVAQYTMYDPPITYQDIYKYKIIFKTQHRACTWLYQGYTLPDGSHRLKKSATSLPRIKACF